MTSAQHDRTRWPALHVGCAGASTIVPRVTADGACDDWSIRLHSGSAETH